jgi:hypothetical protein
MTHRALLLVAYPGHELLLYHWMERERPLAPVMTDRSGVAGVPRLEHTRRIILAAGVQSGSVFGEVTDRPVY